MVWGELTADRAGDPLHLWDKLLHFTAYFGLAGLAFVALGGGRRALVAALGLIVLGGVLEILQGMIGRDMSFYDEVANTLGVAAGILAGWAYLALLAPRRLVQDKGGGLAFSARNSGGPSMFEEFKKFAMRGSVIDLAVGVIVGASFTGIVNSLVKDIINPILGLVIGGIDFSNFFVVLKGDHAAATLADAAKAGDVTLNYGVFVNTLINFLIVAFVLFMVMRQINKLTQPKPAAPAAAPPPAEDVVLLREIRDLLKARA